MPQMIIIFNATICIKMYREHLNQTDENNCLYKIDHRQLNGNKLCVCRCFKNDIFAEIYNAICT